MNILADVAEIIPIFV